MTRPGIVRADTLDLQDQDSPSAQDHSRNGSLQHDFGDNLIGPHQASEIRHVKEERNDEEKNLQQAWGSGESGDVNGVNGVDGNEDGNEVHSEINGSNDDDMMDRISSSPSIDDEDIDFDFVYALHTFVATVEGQANATKGDTMVLLDDSNSYWWLVRVVKDSSIGYLPAEHIETPTERLARLNKHRNVDLSAAMLGDNAERSKNPLKKAMKRRAAKTVQFTDPTYYELSDPDFSDEEEDDELSDLHLGAGSIAAASANSSEQRHGAGIDSIQPATNDTISEQGVVIRDSPSLSGEAPLSPKLLDQDEAAALTKSRKSPTRNQDPFFRDDSVETRKLTLTPNLLRDDSTGGKNGIRSQSSSRLDSPDPFAQFAPDSKEDKKKKEKKGMLSGLFKSKKKEKEKEKTRRKDSSGDVEADQNSGDFARPSTGNSTVVESGNKTREAVDRKSSQKGRRLQKQSPVVASVASTPASSTPTTPIEGPVSKLADQQQQPTSYMAELEGSQVAYEAPTGHEDEIPIGQSAHSNSRNTSSEQQRGPSADFNEGQDEVRASDSLDSNDYRNGSFMHGTEAVHIPIQAGEYDSSEGDNKSGDTAEDGKDGTSTPPSIIEITETTETTRDDAVEAAKSATPSSDDEKTDNDPTPVPSKPQSPRPATESIASMSPSTRSLSAAGDGTAFGKVFNPQRQDSKSSTGSSRAVVTPSPASTNATTWSDAGLRAWLDGDNDVRDMLTIIYDTSNVKPVGADHPLMKDLFREERESLNRMSAELDGLLHGLLQRKGNAVPATA